MTGKAVSFSAGALLFAGVAALVSGCQQANSQPHGGMQAPAVSVVTVEPQSVPATFEYVGQTAGSREVEVRARVGGSCSAQLSRGSDREGGQSMFVVDPAPFEVAASAPRPRSASAEAKLAQAKRNSARLKPLYEARAASQKDYDDATSTEQVAEAEVKTARANVADTQLNLRYTRVEAPVTASPAAHSAPRATYVSAPTRS